MTKLPPENLALIKKVLGGEYISIAVKELSVLDNLEDSTCSITLVLQDGEILNGSGVGMVDAAFNSLKDHYSSRYTSLLDLHLINFFVKAVSKGTKSEVEVLLEVKNSYGNILSFRDNSLSLTASAARASVSAVEYFCNSESAFIKVRSSLESAKLRNRDDLIVRYTDELSSLVQNTCYSGIQSK